MGFGNAGTIQCPKIATPVMKGGIYQNYRSFDEREEERKKSVEMRKDLGYQQLSTLN